MFEPLRGREVVLAGGSGGIGSAVVAQLLSEGAKVVVSFRTQAARASVFGQRVHVVQADLASATDRRRLLDAAPSLYGLVVLSGDPARGADGAQIEAAMQRSHESNYFGPILLAREAVERMRQSGTPGAIILLSSMQANALFPGSLAYAAQKAALQHAALVLAKECRGPGGIRVNVVAPGVTAVGMAAASIAAGKYDRYITEGVIERFGLSEDVARAVRFFLEPDNFITGQVLCVDGGLTL